MEKFTYTITDPAGIHACPAGLLVKTAAGFKSTCKVEVERPATLNASLPSWALASKLV